MNINYKGGNLADSSLRNSRETHLSIVRQKNTGCLPAMMHHIATPARNMQEQSNDSSCSKSTWRALLPGGRRKQMIPQLSLTSTCVPWDTCAPHTHSLVRAHLMFYSSMFSLHQTRDSSLLISQQT